MRGAGTDCRGCGLANHASWCPEIHHGSKPVGDWITAGRCGDADMFPASREATLRAKALCLECPVREACLTHACAISEDDGIWGAATPRERRSLGRSPTAERIAQHFKNVGRRVAAEL